MLNLFKAKTPQPVKFPEKNFTYRRPDSMTEEECGDLPCFRSSNPVMTTSCWRVPFWQRVKLVFTGNVWLTLVWPGHPPVAVTIHKPAFPKKPEKQENAQNG